KRRLATLEKQVQDCGKALSSLQGQESNARSQLSPKWNGQVEKIDSKAVNALDREHQRLVAAGVGELYRQLEQDATPHGELMPRQSEVKHQIEEVPEDGRVSVAEAEEQLAAARQAATIADTARDAAKETADHLAGELERFRQLVEQINTAEKMADLHR